MKKPKNRTLVACLAGLFLLVVATPGWAETPIQLHLGADSLAFDVTADHAGGLVVLQGPNGLRLERQFTADAPLRMDLQHRGESLPDGLYTYEVRLSAPSASKRDPAEERTHELSPQEAAPYLSGYFRISGGVTVQPTQEQRAPHASSPERQARARDKSPEVDVAADQLIADDLSVTGGLCVGFDCTSTESYPSDEATMRLKEVNNRLHFQDTSTGNFPSSDWRLVANEITTGGANYLAVEDSDYGFMPFVIEANSRANALHLDDNDNVGFGTATPRRQLHAVDGDTPALRLQQDGSQGFQLQTWDLEANEVGFAITDVDTTNTPFWVLGDAPNNAFAVTTNGAIGIGTRNPIGDMHMIRSGVPVDIVMADSSSGRNWTLRLSGSGFAVSKAADAASFLVYDDGRVRMGPSGVQNFLLASNGNLTIQGNLTESSDVAAKHRFEEIDTASILDGLRRLPLTTWSYRDDPISVRHLGPTAQEFEKIFGLGNGDPTHLAGMDVRGVALAAIQELADRGEDKDHEISVLREMIQQLAAQNRALEQRLEALETD